MAKYDSAKAMENSLRYHRKPCWQCQDCGKIYPSLEALQNAGCSAKRSPYGWGKCDCGKDAIMWYKGLWPSIAYGNEMRELKAEHARKQQEIQRQREERLTSEKRAKIDTMKAFDSRWKGTKSLWPVSLYLLTSCMVRAFENEDSFLDSYEGNMLKIYLEGSIFEIKKQERKIELKDYQLPYIDLLEENLQSFDFWKISEIIALYGQTIDIKTSQPVGIQMMNMVDFNNCLIVPILNEDEQGEKALDCLRESLQDWITVCDNDSEINSNAHFVSERNYVESILEDEDLDDKDFWKSWYALVRLPIDINM